MDRSFFSELTPLTDYSAPENSEGYILDEYDEYYDNLPPRSSHGLTRIEDNRDQTINETMNSGVEIHYDEAEKENNDPEHPRTHPRLLPVFRQFVGTAPAYTEPFWTASPQDLGFEIYVDEDCREKPMTPASKQATGKNKKLNGGEIRRRGKRSKRTRPAQNHVAPTNLRSRRN